MSVNKVNSDGSTTLISGSTLWADSPIGTILAYGGATAPAGWFICDGTELTKTDYAELYAVIGDSFGTASVNTKFVLPDLREATTKGVGENPNGEAHVKSGGLALGEYIDDRLQDHTHIGTYNDYPNGVYYATSGNQFKAQTGSISSEARKGATTEVKAVGVNYIIKAKQVALPADLESAVEDAVEEAIDTWTTITPTLVTTSGRTWVELKCAKRGDNIVSISGIIELSEISEANSVATGLPKPKSANMTTNGSYEMIPCFCGTNSSGVNVRVNKDGNLIVYNSVNTGNLYFGATYACID